MRQFGYETIKNILPPMSAIHVWLLIAALFFIVELFTSGFAVICLSIGALFAFIAALVGADFAWQVAVFCIGSLVSFFTIRPLLQRIFFDRNDKAEVKTNADALVGRTAIVVEDIDNTTKKGFVQIDGDVWRAVASGGLTQIAQGQVVEVVSRESIVLTVVVKQ